MPFGLKTAGVTYNRLLKMVRKGAINLENFINGVIGHSESFDGHLAVLRDLFTRVKAANLKTKPSKTKFGYPEMEFLGHVVSQGYIKPTEAHMEKILNAPVPKTKKDVRSLLGAVNFIRKFIPNCAGVLKSITDLTSNGGNENVKWQEIHQRAFDKIKEVMTSRPVLRLFQLNKDHVLQTDAINSQIGEVLMQREDDAKLHPVLSAIGKQEIIAQGSRYAIAEKEDLAIFWAVYKFYEYLYGTKFTLQTVCEALTILNGKPVKTARILRWQILLQNFDFTVEVIRSADTGLLIT